jgi:hypothetical protein
VNPISGSPVSTWTTQRLHTKPHTGDPAALSVTVAAARTCQLLWAPDMESCLPPDVAAAVGLGGEMGPRIVSFDWESHPLGPLAGWPGEFRIILAAAITSRFPTVLWLGPRPRS